MVQGSGRARHYEQEEQPDQEFEASARALDVAIQLNNQARHIKAIELVVEKALQTLAIAEAKQRRLLRRQTTISLAVGAVCLLATLITGLVVAGSRAPAQRVVTHTLPAPTAQAAALAPANPVALEPTHASSSYIEAPPPVALGRYGDTAKNTATIAAPKIIAPPPLPVQRPATTATPARQISPFENSVRARLANTKQTIPDNWKSMFDLDKDGDTRGKLQIAAKFLKGEDVKPDPVFAVSLIRQAAIAGNKEAMLWLAQSYEAGNFGRPDTEAAVRWYTSATKAGVNSAYADLGRLYEKGVDGAPDKEAALAWYERGAQAGDVKSAEAVQRLTRAAAVTQQSAPDNTLLSAIPAIAATPVVASTTGEAGENTTASDSVADIRAAQRMLKVLGYKVDKDDGQLGPQTTAAIRAYQRDRAAYPDGEFTPDLLESLTREIRYGQ